MLKKVLVSVALLGVLILGGASAASAAGNGYPPVVGCTANPNPIVVGQTSVITCTGLQPNVTGTLTVTGPRVNSGTLSSVALAATSSDSVTKTTTAAGTVSVEFHAPAPGGFAVSLEAENGQTGSTTVTVAAPASGSSSGLPTTGGTLPAAAIWLGLGAIGLGGIAVAAAIARRRAHSDR